MRINTNKNYTFSEYVNDTNLTYIRIYDGKGNQTYLQIRLDGTINLVTYNDKNIFLKKL